MAKRKYTTVAERRDLLKELNVTAEDMQRFFEENIEINFKIRALHSNGLTWEDLTIWQMRELPTLKQKTLEELRKKKEVEEAEQKKKEEEQKQKQYYTEHFEEIMLNKIDKGEKLEENEISKLVLNYEIQCTHGENRRWSRTNESIIELNSRYFSIEWEEGLTENQDNNYDSQPVEVRKHTYEKTITVTEWLPIS